MMTSLPHCGSAGGDALRRWLEAIGSNSVTVQLWIQVFWVISVQFNIRNTLPKYFTFLLGHPACIYFIFVLPQPKRPLRFLSQIFSIKDTPITPPKPDALFTYQHHKRNPSSTTVHLRRPADTNQNDQTATRADGRDTQPSRPLPTNNAETPSPLKTLTSPPIMDKYVNTD